MPESISTSAMRFEQLRELLLGYLQQIGWPGADGLTINDMLRCYPLAMIHGAVPGEERLLQEHPELAAELKAFFAGPARWGGKDPDSTMDE